MHCPSNSPRARKRERRQVHDITEGLGSAHGKIDDLKCLRLQGILKANGSPLV